MTNIVQERLLRCSIFDHRPAAVRCAPVLPALCSSNTVSPAPRSRTKLTQASQAGGARHNQDLPPRVFEMPTFHHG